VKCKRRNIVIKAGGVEFLVEIAVTPLMEEAGKRGNRDC